jgi:2-iminobutanoate/2-iminopropanoate deaminase
MTKKLIPYPGDFPLSKAIIHNNKLTMEISGFIGINLETGKLAEGIEEQTSQALENIKETLEDEKWDLSDIIKIKIYLTNMEDYAKVNKIYKKYFLKNYPTRAVVEVNALPANALIEIECTASKE